MSYTKIKLAMFAEVREVRNNPRRKIDIISFLVKFKKNLIVFALYCFLLNFVSAQGIFVSASSFDSDKDGSPDSIQILYQGGPKSVYLERLKYSINFSSLKTLCGKYAQSCSLGTSVVERVDAGYHRVIVSAEYKDGTSEIVLNTYVDTTRSPSQTTSISKYFLTVYVKDRNGNPLVGNIEPYAKVLIRSSFEKVAESFLNSSGKANFLLPSGIYNLEIWIYSKEDSGLKILETPLILTNSRNIDLTIVDFPAKLKINVYQFNNKIPVKNAIVELSFPLGFETQEYFTILRAKTDGEGAVIFDNLPIKFWHSSNYLEISYKLKITNISEMPMKVVIKEFSLKSYNESISVNIPLEYGKLNIQSNPSGAKVFINNEYKGVTPISLELIPGFYSLKIMKEGYEEKAENITISEGDYKILSIELSKIDSNIVTNLSNKTPSTSQSITTPPKNTFNNQSGKGMLYISSSPLGAEIYVNGSYSGTTPANISLYPGCYNIKILKSGYYDYEKNITISGGELINLIARLEPILLPSETPLESKIDSNIVTNLSNKTPSTSQSITTPPKNTFNNQSGKGMLYISSSPLGAEIYVNGSYSGTTPANISLYPGCYNIKILKSGYYDYEKNITISGGELINLIARLEPILLPSETPLELKKSLEILKTSELILGSTIFLIFITILVVIKIYSRSRYFRSSITPKSSPKSGFKNKFINKKYYYNIIFKALKRNPKYPNLFSETKMSKIVKNTEENREDKEKSYSIKRELDKNKLEAKLLEIDKALQEDPNNPELWNLSGNINMQLKNYEKAIECYEKALKIDENNSTAKMNLLVAKKYFNSK